MHKEKTQRQKRINKRVQMIVAKAFNQSNFEIGGKKILVGINKADISPDFRNVSIYLDIVGISDKDKKMIAKELNKPDSIRVIKKIITKDLDLRVSPNPTFLLDKFQEGKERITSLIEKEAKEYKKED